MRILMIAACPFPTGQGTQVMVRHLAQALGMKHDLVLLTYGYPSHVRGSYRHYPVRTPYLGLRSGPRWGKVVADALLVRAGWQLHRSTAFDVMHAHNAEGLAIGLALRALTRVPLVYHAHNTMHAELPTYVRSKAMLILASAFGRVWDQAVPRWANATIAFDERQAKRHTTFGVASHNTWVIPPAIDELELACFRSERTADTILYAGNPDNYQNLPLLWRTWHRVREKRSTARLCLASAAPVEHFVSARELPPGVFFERCTTLGEVGRAHRHASLGVCTRTLGVGAPIKILNYWATGLPVACAASGAGALSKMFADASLGFMCSSEPAALAHGILRLLDQNEPVTFPATHSVHRQCVLYENVYRHVLANGAPRRHPAMLATARLLGRHTLRY